MKSKKGLRVLSLSACKRRQSIIRGNEGASLVDIGDGIVCLEFHTKMNTFNGDVLLLLGEALELVDDDFLGMVIANDGEHFSVGADLKKIMEIIRQDDWNLLERVVRDFQDTMMLLKYLSKPVVIAPAGMTFGGATELCLHAARCHPHMETRMGLVETGIGLIPGGAGTKEMMVRFMEGLPNGVIEKRLNLQPFYVLLFEVIGQARIARSALEAVRFGFIRKGDDISLEREYQLWEAKQIVLGLSCFYKPPKPALIPVMGENLRGICDVLLYSLRSGGYLSDYDVHVSRKLAHVLSGGDCREGTLVAEQEILDLEREAFLSLCGEPKTQERIVYTLKTGKVLRN